MADYKIVTYSDQARGIRQAGVRVKITPNGLDPEVGDTDDNGVFQVVVAGDQDDWNGAMVDDDFGTNDPNPQDIASPETTWELEVFPNP